MIILISLTELIRVKESVREKERSHVVPMPNFVGEATLHATWPD